MQMGEKKRKIYAIDVNICKPWEGETCKFRMRGGIHILYGFRVNMYRPCLTKKRQACRSLLTFWTGCLDISVEDRKLTISLQKSLLEVY
jgi:hypothetical protein